MHDRLRQARIDAGFDSAAAAARRLGVAYGTYSGHENGQRGIRTDDLPAYAKAFKTTVAWLAFGEKSSDETISVPVRGIIRNYSLPLIHEGSNLLAIEMQGETELLTTLKEMCTSHQVVLDFAVPSDVVAFQVYGMSMMPHLFNGDCFLVRENQRFDFKDYDDENVFIYTSDNQIYYAHRFIVRDGSFVIIHHNASYRVLAKPKAVLEIFALMKERQIRRAGTVLADEFREADRRGSQSSEKT